MKAVGNIKTCNTCKEVYDLSNFHKNRAMPDGLHSQCKACGNAARKAHKEKYPEKAKRWNKENPHYSLSQAGVNVTAEDFHKLLSEQNGKCAVCGYAPKENEKRLCIDHDHNTNEVRGLLCSRCNRGIGMFGDNANFLKSAASYLER
jgi:hypothetical protein